MPVPNEISDHPVSYEKARSMVVERCHCWEVVDGDTLYVQTDLGHHRTPDIGIRIEGPDRRKVDAPEIYGVKHESEEYRLGKESFEFVKAVFEDFPYSAGPVGPVLHRPWEVGKFGRSIGRVWLLVNFDLVPSSPPDGMLLTKADPIATSGDGEYVWADMAMFLVEHGHAEWEE